MFLVALAPIYEWLVVGLVVLGVGVAGHHPAHFPLLSDATPEAYRGRAFSVHGLAGSLGFAAMPTLITVVLATGYSWRYALGLVGAVGGVYAAVTLLTLWRCIGSDVTSPALARESTDDALGERVRDRLGTLAASPAILALALLALVSSTAAWGVTSYASVYLTDGYGVPLDTANLALTGMFIASAVMILVGGMLADHFSPGLVMVVSYALVALVIGTLATGLLPPLAAVGFVVLVGAVRSPSAPARSTLADRISEHADLGQNFAVITVGIMLGSSIAPILFGVLIERAGHGIAFGGIAGIAIVALGVTLWVLYRYGSTGVVRSVPAAGDD